MQEILTPVRYEPALDVLNLINKLYIDKRVSLSIYAMQACKNPVGTGNPIIGKFCKGDNHGAIACHLPENSFDNYEYAYYEQSYPDDLVIHVFAQKIKGFLIRHQVQRYPDYWVEWQTLEGYTIVKLTPNTQEWFDFEGDTLRFENVPAGPAWRFWLYGFY